MSTVPPSNMAKPIQPPNVDKFNPFSGKGIVNIGPPLIGATPPSAGQSAYQAEPTTGFGKGGPAGNPHTSILPFRDDE